MTIKEAKKAGYEVVYLAMWHYSNGDSANLMEMRDIDYLVLLNTSFWEQVAEAVFYGFIREDLIVHDETPYEDNRFEHGEIEAWYRFTDEDGEEIFLPCDNGVMWSSFYQYRAE